MKKFPLNFEILSFSDVFPKQSNFRMNEETSERFPLYIGDYEVKEEIQTTSNCVIFGGYEKKTSHKVAIKISREKGNNPDIENEYNIMSRLNNQYIMKCIKYYDRSQSGIDRNVLIMPKAAGLDLYTFLYDVSYIEENQVQVIMKTLLEAVNYLHSQSICHLDIKLENIFCMDGTGNPAIVLGDFGSSGVFPDNQIEKFCGTLEYWAPEKYKNQKCLF